MERYTAAGAVLVSKSLLRRSAGVCFFVPLLLVTLFLCFFIPLRRNNTAGLYLLCTPIQQNYDTCDINLYYFVHLLSILFLILLWPLVPMQL
jgi:hypothetical protein